MKEAKCRACYGEVRLDARVLRCERTKFLDRERREQRIVEKASVSERDSTEARELESSEDWEQVAAAT